LIGASGGVRVKLDDANRQVVVSELDEDTAVPGAIRSFQLDKLCALYRGYQKRYGEKSDAKADTDLGYRPTAAEELRDAVAEILQLEDDHPGSAVGKRLVYTLPADDLARIEELLGLLEAAGGGESNALTLDRGNRARLAKLHSNFGGEGTLVSAMLWQIFKDCDVPVYIDRGQMDGFDLEYDTTEVTLDGAHSHYDGLKALASEQDFFIDSKHGALRLHEDFFEGASSYRVFDVADLLAALEKDYAELKTDDDLAEGFHGDLRTQGGVQVVVDALTTQLDNAGFTPLIRAYGPRVVVVGGVDVVDRAAEVLKAIGWQPPSDKGETK
jgi:hypothetical protein